jgi:hypothetical protein
MNPTTWVCPHCGRKSFLYSLSWHLYTVHDINLNSLEYSREFYSWLREGVHTLAVMGRPVPGTACPLRLAACPRFA